MRSPTVTFRVRLVASGGARSLAGRTAHRRAAPERFAGDHAVGTDESATGRTPR